MMAAYGLDLLDPKVTPRRIWTLAHRLPPWARLPGEPWSAEADLMALLVDHVAQLTWVTLRVAGAKGATRPKPIPRPPRAASRPPAARPGPPEPSPGAGTWGQAIAQLAAMPGVVVSND